MISVKFDPTQLEGAEKDWWDRWQRRAEAAIDGAIADMEANRPHTFKSEIWRELKEWLLDNVFHKKCAYCESKITATSFGDAEHYRPKGKVTVKGQTVEGHRGYYWLAYHWKNLIPACQRCNSDLGKLTQFPVAKKHIQRHEKGRADPDALDALEEPLLLHPYRDDPRKHLQFGLRGIIAPRDGSVRGKETVEICSLYRDDLRSERQREQEAGWLRFLSLLMQTDPNAYKVYEGLLKTGSESYSAAVLDYIELRLEQTQIGFSRPKTQL